MEKLESRIAHLERIVEDLSDVIARQDNDIEQLKSRLKIVMAREVEREAAGSGGIVLADERPPHY